MRLLLIIFILLLSVGLVSARWFVPDTPPGVAPGTVCLLEGGEGCNMTGDIDMNNNTIYNANFINGTFSGSVNGSDITNPIWVEIAGDVMTGSLNMSDNSFFDVLYGYFTKVFSSDWSNISGTSDIISLPALTINESQINDLSHTVDTNTHVAAVGPYLYDDATNMYFNESQLNNTVGNLISNTTLNGSNIDGYPWWTNVDTITDSNTYFYWNTTNSTLELWVNNILQQDWGASTTVYTEATFLDSIFGDGSTLLNICLPNGTTVNGQPCNATSVFETDETWILNLLGIATFNESKLNGTIDARANGTHTLGAGLYLYNVVNDSIFIYANMSVFNATMDERDGDYCAGGICGPLNITGDVYQNGNYYLNGSMWLIELNATLIETINLSAAYINALEIMVGAINATNMTVERLSASIFWADSATIVNMSVENLNASKIFTEEFVVNGSVTGLCLTNGTGCPDTNGTHTVGAGPYLYNIQDSEKTNIYINDTVLISTIDNRTGIFELNFTILAAGGIGNNASTFNFPRLTEVLDVTVTPTTLTNKYRSHINGTTTGTVIDRDRLPHIGEWHIGHRGALIQSETMSGYITEATIDELFIIKVRYRQ